MLKVASLQTNCNWHKDIVTIKTSNTIRLEYPKTSSFPLVYLASQIPKGTNFIIFLKIQIFHAWLHGTPYPCLIARVLACFGLISLEFKGVHNPLHRHPVRLLKF